MSLYSPECGFAGLRHKKTEAGEQSMLQLTMYYKARVHKTGFDAYYIQSDVACFLMLNISP